MEIEGVKKKHLMIGKGQRRWRVEGGHLKEGQQRARLLFQIALF